MTTASCPSPTSAQVNYNLTHPSANISANHSVCNRTESGDDEYVYDYDTSLSAPHSARNYIMRCLCFASFHYVYQSSQSSSCSEMFFFLLPVLPVEKAIRMTEERDKWRKYVRGVANRRIEDG